MASHLIELDDILERVFHLPGVQVDRDELLTKVFRREYPRKMDAILEKGPVKAGVPREIIRKKARGRLKDATLKSSAASFMAGLPGGLTLAAALPADVMQNLIFSIRTAQEIAYLYGQENFWQGTVGFKNPESRYKLLSYVAVMFAVTGADQLVRIMSEPFGLMLGTKIAEGTMQRIMERLAAVFGVKLTAEGTSKTVSKVVPVLGGVLSGGMTFWGMKRTGTRLIQDLDQAYYNYLEADMEQDYLDVETLFGDEEEPEEEETEETEETEEEEWNEEEQP